MDPAQRGAVVHAPLDAGAMRPGALDLVRGHLPVHIRRDEELSLIDSPLLFRPFRLFVLFYVYYFRVSTHDNTYIPVI